MKLFLCEKPSQAKDIAVHVGAAQRGDGCITGAGVTVTWCIGHLLEQASPETYVPALKTWNLEHLPVLPESWQMNVKDATKSQYRIVQKLLKQATEVVIATDADREGEVIAREVMQLAGYRGPVQRLWLSAMDAASVKKALAALKPGAATLPLFFSGLGRARADWLAGMNLTMALTKQFGGGGREGVLHCGRVQTPVLALIVRRERAIAHFKPQGFYELRTKFEIASSVIAMQWLPPKTLLDAHGRILDGAVVEAAAQRVRGQLGRVISVAVDDATEPIPLLHSLGSLQREASAMYGMKAQAVLDACQKLYETHKATTYPRTDCEYLPRSMHPDAGSVIQALLKIDPSITGLAEQADPADQSRAFDDRKITAHHAIIPTASSAVSLQAMSDNERAVYKLIRRRYLAQFLGEYRFQKSVIQVDISSIKHIDSFTATGKVPVFWGWKRAMPPAAPAAATRGTSRNKSGEGESDPPESVDIALPACKLGDSAKNVEANAVLCHTSAPKRYTEGTLLSAMESIDREIDDPRLKAIMKGKEKAGIGTDATRSAIIEGLFRRTYIEAKGKQLVPTARAESLIALIERVAPAMADPVLTAQWEEQLGQVESGSLLLEQFEGNLGKWLTNLVAQVRANPRTALQGFENGSPSAAKRPPGATAAQTDSLVPCEQCKAPMRRIQGSKGWFWGCTAYSSGCRHTMNDFQGKPVKAASAKTNQESLGSTPVVELLLKAPAVKQPSKELRAGISCPTCHEGKLIGRQTKDTGRAFWGCARFPQCKFFEWSKPI
jgi:DNA topoisomerase III